MMKPFNYAAKASLKAIVMEKYRAPIISILNAWLISLSLRILEASTSLANSVTCSSAEVASYLTQPTRQ